MKWAATYPVIYSSAHSSARGPHRDPPRDVDALTLRLTQKSSLGQDARFLIGPGSTVPVRDGVVFRASIAAGLDEALAVTVVGQELETDGTRAGERILAGRMGMRRLWVYL
jgi:hypothetical protein